MKTNNNIVGGSLRTDSYAAYAAHLRSFANYMSSNGVPLFAISVQNEPDISVTYESCDWNASQMFNFVKNNAPAIGRSVIIPESFNFNHAMSDTVLNDSIAAANVAIIGGHIYGGGLVRYPLALGKGKAVWMTEHLDTDTSWAHVFATGVEINDCMNADMSAYIWWYIVRFYGPINESGNVSKRGYIMSQFARFIRPGSNRVKATFNPQTNVSVTAYKNGASMTVVALNSGASISQTFVIQNGTATSVTPYVTSSTRDCAQGSAVNVVGGTFTATLDAQSVTTFVSN
jgi:glucuronoarabinoxylan endo-1,4-beta-xylanase